MTSAQRTRRGRPAKMSAQEVRNKMLSTAAKLLLEEGLTVGVENFSMEMLVLEAKVPRSAVHRLWPQKELFFNDLLVALAKTTEAGTSVFDPSTLRDVLDWFGSIADQLDDPQVRLRGLVEACRIGAVDNFHNIVESQRWHNSVILNAAALSYEGELRDRLEQAIRNSQAGYAEGMAHFYEACGKLLGRRIKADFSGSADARSPWIHLAHTGAALMEGMVIRHAVLPPPPETESDPFGTGRSALWPVPAIVYTSTFLAMSEPDPEYDVSQVETRLAQAEKLYEAILEYANARPSMEDLPPEGEDGPQSEE
ncbi:MULTISPECIES: TetR/AcrR family transcriptional regulator [Rhodococcus]|uniref:TetR/AcrR family transcriptional regulator n=1 Tax=Rhodococcus TaxID=1827 RepID=UPI0005CAC7CE|nr:MULTISPECIES: TetR/AcrR family transcriptional regulator [Rhodococcus]MDO1482124.1 TetR/AcrR family transcriptional regulator [Rhodococcus ruber]WKK14761.1 TetR/AcrR family transcriptional regulator [Rhodococcus ruber]